MSFEHTVTEAQLLEQALPHAPVIIGEAFAIFTKEGKSAFYSKVDDTFYLCKPDDLHPSTIRRLKAGQLRPYRVSGLTARKPIQFVNYEMPIKGLPEQPVAAPKPKQEHSLKVVNKTAPESTQQAEKTSMTDSKKEVNVKQDASKNQAIIDLLAKCSSTIEELSRDLDESQTNAYPLKHWAGTQHRTKKAKVKLIEHGLIEHTAQGLMLTPKGKQLAIGVHSRSPITKAMTILYTANVKPYIAEVDAATITTKVTVPFDVISPDGERMTVQNVRAFAKEHCLVPNKLYLLNNGAIGSTGNGWTKA